MIFVPYALLFLNSHHFIKVLDAGANWQIGMNEWIFQPMLAVIRNLWMLIARHIPVLHYVIHSLEQWDLPLSLSLVKVAKHRVVEAHAAVGLWLVVSYVQSLQAAVRMCEQEDWQIIVLGQSFLMEAQGVFQQLLVPLMVAGLALAPPVPPVVHGQELITLLCKFLGKVCVPSSVILLPMDEKNEGLRWRERRVPVCLNLDLLLALLHMEVI